MSHRDHRPPTRWVHLADKRTRCHHRGADETDPPVPPGLRLQDVTPERRDASPGTLPGPASARRPHARAAERTTGNHGAGADILVGRFPTARRLPAGPPRPTLRCTPACRACTGAPLQQLQVGGRSGWHAARLSVPIQTEASSTRSTSTCSTTTRVAAGVFARASQRRLSAYRRQVACADAPAIDDASLFSRRGGPCAAESMLPEGVQLHDPVPMRMTRLARAERAQLLVESTRQPALQHFLGNWLPALYALRIRRELRLAY